MSLVFAVDDDANLRVWEPPQEVPDDYRSLQVQRVIHTSFVVLDSIDRVYGDKAETDEQKPPNTITNSEARPNGFFSFELGRSGHQFATSGGVDVLRIFKSRNWDHETVEKLYCTKVKSTTCWVPGRKGGKGKGKKSGGKGVGGGRGGGKKGDFGGQNVDACQEVVVYDHGNAAGRGYEDGINAGAGRGGYQHDTLEVPGYHNSCAEEEPGFEMLQPRHINQEQPKELLHKNQEREHQMKNGDNNNETTRRHYSDTTSVQTMRSSPSSTKRNRERKNKFDHSLPWSSSEEGSENGDRNTTILEEEPEEEEKEEDRVSPYKVYFEGTWGPEGESGVNLTISPKKTFELYMNMVVHGSDRFIVAMRDGQTGEFLGTKCLDRDGWGISEPGAATTFKRKKKKRNENNKEQEGNGKEPEEEPRPYDSSYTIQNQEKAQLLGHLQKLEAFLERFIPHVSHCCTSTETNPDRKPVLFTRYGKGDDRVYARFATIEEAKPGGLGNVQTLTHEE
ncbi:unnamed protein product [Amoebophrya sp. A25]|nr:unnamed protein product [Amoebophrya sp. A25]|eukprot:GSA25T00014506001.1